MFDDLEPGDAHADDPQTNHGVGEVVRHLGGDGTRQHVSHGSLLAVLHRLQVVPKKLVELMLRRVRETYFDAVAPKRVNELRRYVDELRFTVDTGRHHARVGLEVAQQFLTLLVRPCRQRTREVVHDDFLQGVVLAGHETLREVAAIQPFAGRALQAMGQLVEVLGNSSESLHKHVHKHLTLRGYLPLRQDHRRIHLKLGHQRSCVSSIYDECSRCGHGLEKVLVQYLEPLRLLELARDLVG